ncbi:hypothetical protein QFC22_004426 [Naganishia vaughanmartiniae]|uniref:Uncharacterized protein n=1 Tax=Naganishia vaughanmartiniae TaxID=1424756 RepID=A0ACC2X1T0_9TREE|nr:hypothetical protein QFC22_004426 [Naganishia vaughanmartiniae]
MSVSISPETHLGFERPFDRQVPTSLSVHNPNSKPVAYKVKVTAPKSYVVKPNSGRIEPGETVTVQVILQPMKEEPAINAKSRDKFLLQSCIISVEQEGRPLHDLWSEITDKSSIHEHKLRCVFLPGRGAIPEEAHNGAGDVSRFEDSTFTQARDSHAREASVEPTSPHAFQDTNQTPVRESASTPSSTVAPSRPAFQTQPSNTFVPGPAISSLVQHPPASSPALESSSLEDKLSAAQREIERLKQQLADPQATGLRKRTTGAASEKAEQVTHQAGTAIQQVAQTGVSVPTVVAIAFTVFVVTYLFL